MQLEMFSTAIQPPPRSTPLRRLAASLAVTLRFWMQTEIHVYAFSAAANMLLAFFPFLIVSVSLARLFFNQPITINAIDFALRDVFPDALGQFVHNNLPQPRPVEVVSLVLLFFTANGIFEPLEVAFNRIWSIPKNRSFFRNQVISLGLIFVCGGLPLLSPSITALRQASSPNDGANQWISALFFKLAAAPLVAFVLFLIYRYLPNGRPPIKRVIPAAIIVGLFLEVIKYLNT